MVGVSEKRLWGLRTRVCDARGGLPGGRGGKAEAGWRKLVADLPPGVQRRREFVPLVFESSGYVAKLAKRYIAEWARGSGREGRGGRREWTGKGGSPVPVPARGGICPPRCTIGMRLQPSRNRGMRCWSSCPLEERGGVAYCNTTIASTLIKGPKIVE
jgi:hypothetical protein